MQWQMVTKPKSLGGLGIKDLYLMNKAFTIKHTWQLMTDIRSLWARTYKAKYFPTSFILETKARTNASWAWKKIDKNISEFKRALKWRFDIWAGNKPLSQQIDSNYHVQDQNLQVKEVMSLH